MAQLKYFRTENGTDSRQEISKEKALDIALGTYKDCRMLRDMLTIVNRIPCRFSTIEIEDHSSDHPMVLMAGCEMMIPDGISYDDFGNRI